MKKIWQTYRLFITAFFTAAVTIPATLYTEAEKAHTENKVKFLDIHAENFGGLSPKNLSGGVKAILTDSNGEEIDGYRIVTVNVYNFSGYPIDDGTLVIELSKKINDNFSREVAPRVLAVKVLQKNI